MSKIDLICKNLTLEFPNLNECLEITKEQKICFTDYKNDGSFIIDFDQTNQPFIKLDGITYLGVVDESKIFTVKNVKRIAFLPVDGRKGLIGFGTSQCDFVLFDENDFCFLEFKLNATSIGERAIRNNRKEAVKLIQEIII